MNALSILTRGMISAGGGTSRIIVLPSSDIEEAELLINDPSILESAILSPDVNAENYVPRIVSTDTNELNKPTLMDVSSLVPRITKAEEQ